MAKNYQYKFQPILNFKNGSFRIEVTVQYPRIHYIDGGIFGNGVFNSFTYETVIEFNLLNGRVQIGTLNGFKNPRASFYKDPKYANEKTDWIETSSIFDLGVFEVVNTYDWSGDKPIEIKSQAQGVVATEPAQFDVATVDNYSGRRIIAMRSHCVRDFAFETNSQLNVLIDYVRELLAPWQDQVIRYHKDYKGFSVSHYPENIQPEASEYLNEVLETFKETRPDRRWFNAPIFDEGAEWDQQEKIEKQDEADRLEREEKQRIEKERRSAEFQHRKEQATELAKAGAKGLGRFAMKMGKRMTEGQKMMNEAAEKRAQEKNASKDDHPDKKPSNDEDKTEDT